MPRQPLDEIFGTRGEQEGRVDQQLDSIFASQKIEEQPQPRKTFKTRFLDIGDVAGKGMEAAAEYSGINALGRAIERPVVSFVRGLQMKTAPVSTPFGEVKPYSELKPAEALGEAFTVASAGLPVERLIKTPLTKAAEILYASGAKFRDIKKAGKVVVSAKEAVKTGLKERAWLTEGGVERVAQKIDDFENTLGDAIEKAKGTKLKFSRQELQSYLNEARDLFRNQFDQEAGDRALQEISRIQRTFLKRFGNEIPIEKAQRIKVETGNLLRKYYGQMSGATQEAQKQGVRFLKEKIVEVAPEVGEINKRLRSLYHLDRALGQAATRIRNLNLLGVSSKVGGAVAGPQGFVVGKLLELADSPALKSGAAIGINELAKISGRLGRATKIPVAALIQKIAERISNQE